MNIYELTRDELGLIFQSLIEFSMLLEKWDTPQNVDTIKAMRALAAKINEHLPGVGPGL